MPMKYKTTVHTLEIAVKIPDKDFMRLAKGKEYVNAVEFIGIGKCALRINPHKYGGRNTDRKFHFEYRCAQSYRELMLAICKDLGIEDYTIRRLDICLDPQIDYAPSEKILRLIALMLADEHKMDNIYLSTDPITQQKKTLRISKQIANNGELQIEHYDRSQINQKDWDCFIPNRFELRSMGVKAGANHTEEDIVQGWIDRLKAIAKPEMVESTCSLLAEKLSLVWLNMSIGRIDADGKNKIKGLFNNFLLFNLDSIYTKQQLVKMFMRYGEDEKHAKFSANNLKSGRQGFFFNQLFEPKYVAKEIESMIQALEGFIEG